MGTYKFKTTNIKGKPYVEVNERIKYFESHPKYKGWSRKEEIISHRVVKKYRIAGDPIVKITPATPPRKGKAGAPDIPGKAERRVSVEDWSLEPDKNCKEVETVIVNVTLYDEKKDFVTNSICHESSDMSYINETSFVENAMTSAYGRALGSIGIGIDTSIATYEEVQNAINNETSNTTSTTKEDTNKIIFDKIQDAKNAKEMESIGEYIKDNKSKLIKRELDSLRIVFSGKANEFNS